MGSVTDIADFRPHAAGPVVCFRCEHTWVAVRPANTALLDCPRCDAQMGADLDTLLLWPEMFLGDYCCGQVDSEGVCFAPACIRGSALRLIEAIRTAYALEHRTETDGRSDEPRD